MGQQLVGNHRLKKIPPLPARLETGKYLKEEKGNPWEKDVAEDAGKGNEDGQFS